MRGLVAALAGVGLGGLVGACFSAPGGAVLFACEYGGADDCPPGYECRMDGCCHEENQSDERYENTKGDCSLGPNATTANTSSGSGTSAATSTGSSGPGSSSGGTDASGSGGSSAGSGESSGNASSSGGASTTGSTGGSGSGGSGGSSSSGGPG